MPKTSSLTKSLTRGLTQDLFKNTFVNQYSLLFDGVDDYVYSGTSSGADYNGGSVANKSYSFWAKTTDTGTWNSVFDHGSATRGAFHFTVNATHRRHLLYMGSSNYRYWVHNTETYDGTWHHHVVVLTTDITASKYYLDGALQSVQSTVSTGGQNGYTHGVRQGRAHPYYYKGSLDEFAVFDGELSAADVLAIYNNGTPADLSRFSPEVWWRNGDGDVAPDIINHGSGVFSPVAAVLYNTGTPPAASITLDSP